MHIKPDDRYRPPTSPRPALEYRVRTITVDDLSTLEDALEQLLNREALDGWRPAHIDAELGYVVLERPRGGTLETREARAT